MLQMIWRSLYGILNPNFFLCILRHKIGTKQPYSISDCIYFYQGNGTILGRQTIPPIVFQSVTSYFLCYSVTLCFIFNLPKYIYLMAQPLYFMHVKGLEYAPILF